MAQEFLKRVDGVCANARSFTAADDALLTLIGEAAVDDEGDAIDIRRLNSGMLQGGAGDAGYQGLDIRLIKPGKRRVRPAHDCTARFLAGIPFFSPGTLPGPSPNCGDQCACLEQIKNIDFSDVSYGQNDR
jgi:hypothetical protein